MKRVIVILASLVVSAFSFAQKNTTLHGISGTYYKLTDTLLDVSQVGVYKMYHNTSDFNPALSITNRTTGNTYLSGIRLATSNQSTGLFFGIHSGGFSSPYEAFINQERNADLVFLTSNTEAVRINSAGNIAFKKNGTPGVGKVPTGTDANGNWTWQTIPTLTGGSYAPTLTNQTNISASALQEAIYTRIGNVVHVAMSVNITPTTSGTNTVLYFTLPIATAAISGVGVVTGGGGLNISGSAVRNSSTTGQIAFTSTTTSNQTYYMQYDYIVQ